MASTTGRGHYYCSGGQTLDGPFIFLIKTVIGQKKINPALTVPI